MKPSPKHPQIEAFLDLAFNRTNMIRSDRCVSCHGHASYFRDDLSAREYVISGLCQRCQDEVFASEDDDE